MDLHRIDKHIMRMEMCSALEVVLDVEWAEDELEDEVEVVADEVPEDKCSANIVVRNNGCMSRVEKSWPRSGPCEGNKLLSVILAVFFVAFVT